MKIDCPHCGVHGSVDDSLAGKKIRCPKCSKVFLVTDDIVSDADESNLVHQEIPRNSPDAAEPAAMVADVADDLGNVEETAVADKPAPDEELEVLDDDIFDPAPVPPAAEDIFAFDDDSDDADEDETEMHTCSTCGQSFATASLTKIDSKFYCALCEPENEEDDELSFEDEELDSSVEDEDFLAFTGDDDVEDSTSASTSDNLEVCAGCGESFHPQFLDSYEGKQYCALCLPEDEDDKERLLFSEEVEGDDEEGIEIEVDTFDNEYPDFLDTLVVDNTDDRSENRSDEEIGEGDFPQGVCCVCGEKFHKDFLQEIDSKLYCGICQPEVVETVPTEEVAAFSAGEGETGDDFEDGEKVQGGDTDFTVGDIIREAWQKTKGVKGTVWGAVFVMYLILGSLSFAGFYSMQGMAQSSLFTVIGGLLQFTTSWLSMLFTGGLILIGVRRAREQRVNWKMVFAAFSLKKFISMSIATALQLFLITIGFVLLVIPGIYLLVGYALTLPLILDKGLGPWKAIETSRKAIHKKWWTVFGMYLVMMLLYLVSAIPLGIGLIWAVPMFMVLTGVLYARLFGYSDEEEGDDEVAGDGAENEEDPENDDEDAAEDTVEESEESL